MHITQFATPREALFTPKYLFDARIDLDDMNAMLGTDLPTQQGDTLGGFIYSQLGKVPAVGEQIFYDGYLFEVKNVVRRRIKKVRVCRQAPDEDRGGDREEVLAHAH